MIVESVGNCDDTFCHKEVLRSVAHDLKRCPGKNADDRTVPGHGTIGRCVHV